MMEKNKKKISMILGLFILFLNISSSEAFVFPYKTKTFEGFRLFQDSDDAEVLYYLPLYFQVKRKNGKEPLMTHTFYDRASRPFSFYKFVLQASVPSNTTLQKIKKLARKNLGVEQPRIEPAPISDIFMKAPRITFGAMSEAMSYSVPDWEDSVALSVADIYQPIAFHFFVDHTLEPATANSMMQAGIVFPSVKIKFKGSFTPRRATLQYNQKIVHNYFQAGTVGSHAVLKKIFSWDLTHEIEQLKETKALIIDVECNLPDSTQNLACNEQLEKSLLEIFKEQEFEKVLKPVTPSSKSPSGIFGLVYQGKNSTDEEIITIDIRHTIHEHFYYDVEPIINNLPQNRFDEKVFNLENIGGE